MSELRAEAAADQPPQTGDARVDAVLAELGDLATTPLAEHPARLAEAQQALHRILDEA
ncbi:hypothetical protein [Granulicoccus phenolivorans]|uniref:hypothetical protein n=1 Tax=Granulicoccus phenolivorans TaxID=266854 RepID=UPI000414578B|nr:hypothetical protein [Granulicoccus phenolivorans]